MCIRDRAKTLMFNPSLCTHRVMGLLSLPGCTPVSYTHLDVYKRQRKSWADAASQKGAFNVLDNAKRCADENPGYSVFDEAGKVVYAGSAAASTYTVQKGDSLWAIAEKRLGNGTRYNEIKKLNGLTSDVIYAGQVLKLPNR